MLDVGRLQFAFVEVAVLGQRLRQYWLDTGVQVLPGVSLQQLDAFEKRHGVLLPPDVRDYFSTVDGMPDCESDGDFISFWELARLEPVRNDLNTRLRAPVGARYFYFADWSIDAHRYAILLSRTPGEATTVVSTGVASGGGVCAPGFRQFVDLYLQPTVGEFSSAVLGPR